MLTVTPITAFTDNYIWALHDERYVVLVDPGDAAPCADFLKTNSLDLLAILVTHHHGDHVGGIPDLATHYQPCIYGPAKENIPGMTHPVSAGNTITITEMGLQFDVIGTPGHTLGHVSFYGDGRLFCGDTLFACGCGRLFEGTPDMMLSSLSRLSRLPDDTQVFCAHEYTLNNIRYAKTVDGNNPTLIERELKEEARRQAGIPTLPSTIGLEKATNPFLRCHEPALGQAAHNLLKHSPKNAVEVFAALRQAKDVFRA